MLGKCLVSSLDGSAGQQISHEPVCVMFVHIPMVSKAPYNFV